VTKESSATAELKRLKEVAEALRNLQSRKTTSMGSYSLLPIICSLVDQISTTKIGMSDDEEMLGDFSIIGTCKSSI
jgi:hypothetical protein